MKLIPLGDRILVELDDITNRKVGSIYMADTSGEKMRTARVIAVGETANGFKVGDRIAFDHFSGYNAHAPALGIVDDNKLRFLMASEVIAKVGD